MEEIPELKFTPMRDAIKDLYGWYRENRHKIEKELFVY